MNDAQAAVQSCASWRALKWINTYALAFGIVPRINAQEGRRTKAVSLFCEGARP